MIGTSIIKIRKKKKMTQMELADKAGVSQSHISLVEKNKKKPSMKLLEDIAQVLEVPLAIMFWFTLDKSQVPEHKQEAFEYIKPSVDEMILSFFESE